MNPNDTYAHFKEKLIIDESDLDGACRDHAHQHSEIAERHAYCVSGVADVKDQIADAQAELTPGIRESLAKAKAGTGPAGRITDKQIEAELNADPQMVALRKQLRSLERMMRKWEALRQSSHDRGFMLRILSDREVAGVTTPRHARPTKKGERLTRSRGE